MTTFLLGLQFQAELAKAFRATGYQSYLYFTALMGTDTLATFSKGGNYDCFAAGYATFRYKIQKNKTSDTDHTHAESRQFPLLNNTCTLPS